jgi:hypothetical protein
LHKTLLASKLWRRGVTFCETIKIGDLAKSLEYHIAISTIGRNLNSANELERMICRWRSK